MPFVNISHSPLAPGVSPVLIHYREAGRGRPLLFLHGGWGYGIYPFDKQMEVFVGRHRIIIPDRSGYGRSARTEGDFPTDFHSRAAGETLSVIDALGVESAVLWGHSDGAVIAAMMGLLSPARFRGLILEAFHFYRAKASSRAFFESIAVNPVAVGEKACQCLALDHGEGWPEVIRRNGRAWLEIARQATRPKEDLFGGRLAELTVPTLFIHGSLDPRTEAGELDAVRESLPKATFGVIEGGRHSPHSESGAADQCNRLAGEFLGRVLH